EMLTHWQMRPTAVSNGPEALFVLEHASQKGEPFRLALLDAQMPEMDGFELAGQIQQRPELVGATIMMLSSANQSGDTARCRELNIALYLIKPITGSDLLGAIRKALAGTLVTQGRPLPPYPSAEEKAQVPTSDR